MLDYLTGVTRDDKADGGAWLRSPAIGVIHSTEGGSWPGYGNGSGAPHLTLDPQSRQVRQHVRFGRAARSLRNRAGGQQTNRAGTIQLEVIGTCARKLAQDRGWTYLPDLHDDDLAWLATILAEVHEATGVPLTTSVEWRDYRDGAKGGSYGERNGLRLGERAWAQYTGWLGHMHVPENDHGDPGSLNVPRVLEYARALAAGIGPVHLEPAHRVSEPPTRAAPSSGSYLGPFPLPLGHWFGPASSDRRNHSGHWEADREHVAALLAALRGRGWRDVPTGDRYTTAVAQLVTRYQADAGLRRDGLTGPATWLSIATSTVR